MKDITARTTINNNYFTITANDVFFNYYIDTTELSTIKKIVHTDYLDLFFSICNAAFKTGKKECAILKMLYLDNNYHDTLCYASKSTLSKDSFVELELIDVENLYAEYSNDIFEIEKQRGIITLDDVFCFEYDSLTNNIKIFHMNNSNDIIFVLKDFSKWKDEVISNEYVKDENINLFTSFYDDVILGTDSFSYEIESSFLTNGEASNNLLLKGNTYKRRNNHFIVSGTLKITNDNPKTDYLMFEANKDGLTGLLNKKMTNEIAKKRVESKPNKPLHFIIIDIDNFKLINDNLGHLCGDSCLTSVSKIFLKVVGNKGIVGRIGGDEFFVLLEGIPNKENLRAVLRSIRMSIEAEFLDKFDGIQVTCSMGISEYPKDSDDFETLFKLADMALYIAKKKGKNRYIIYDANIHGTLENNQKNASASLEDCKKNPSISLNLRSLDKSRLILDVLHIVQDDLPSKTERIFSLIGNIFDLNRIIFYYGDDLDLFASWKMTSWIEDGLEEKGSFIYKDNFLYDFNKDDVFVITNTCVLEDSHPQIFAHLKANLIKSCVFCAVKHKNTFKGFISFEITTSVRHWSENEINVLAVITGLLEQMLR